jgi:hypothetical protein
MGVSTFFRGFLPPKDEAAIVKYVSRKEEYVEKRAKIAHRVAYSPFKLLKTIDFMGWMLLLSGWLAWTCDGYDYFSGWSAKS